jgi:anti-sigma B factor antagonist
MRVEPEIRDGVSVVRLKGRFVTGSDAELVSAKKYLDEIGVCKAVLDFRGVPYIDSTGLAFVVELHKDLRKRGGQLVLTNVNARVREVLELTRIGEVVSTFESEEAAEAALRGSELLTGCAGL